MYIEDLDSAAGTFVGGRQIKPGLQYALTPGADVRLGDGGCRFTVTLVDGDDYEAEIFSSDDERTIDDARPEMAIVEGADVTLNAVNDGERPAASPWGVIGGLKGMGENLGAAIFNSKINVNYQYKPTYSVGGAGGGPAGLSDLKSALLLALADTERGLRTDGERRRKIEQLARALEAKNPDARALKSPLMNGRWALQYTTALEVLGKNRPGFLRPKGAIWQTVDIFTLQVKNEESFEPLPFVKFKNATTSDLDAQTESRAGVRPKDWRVAGVKFDAPPDSPSRMARNMEMKASGAGSLAWMDTTFVDGEMRISRIAIGGPLHPRARRSKRRLKTKTRVTFGWCARVRGATVSRARVRGATVSRARGVQVYDTRVVYMSDARLVVAVHRRRFRPQLSRESDSIRLESP